MITITVWLLISIGSNHHIGRSTEVVERFATVEECERVNAIVSKTYTRAGGLHQCVQATIVRPW